MFKILKMHLRSNEYDNHIYYGLTNEELNELKSLLKNDYGYLDLVMEFTDAEKLIPLFNAIPENLNKESIIRIIYEQYICYKLLCQVEIPQFLKFWGVANLDEVENAIFSGDFEKFASMKFIFFDFLDRLIDEKAKEMGKRARMHVFIDEIKDVNLQKYINTFIGSRMPIAIMGYTAKEQLLTYNTYFGQIIENVHDYRSFYKEDFYARLRKKYNQN